MLQRVCSIAFYKRMLQHQLEALRCLDSVGLVHRDPNVANTVYAADGSRLALCDLECRWGMRCAPEISLEDTLDAGWTTASAVYDFDSFIQGKIYANVPRTGQVPWPVPAPVDAVVAACKRSAPAERPSLEELRAMVDAIATHDRVSTAIDYA